MYFKHHSSCIRCHAVATFTLIIMFNSPAIHRLFQSIQGNTLSEVCLLMHYPESALSPPLFFIQVLTSVLRDSKLDVLQVLT